MGRIYSEAAEANGPAPAPSSNCVASKRPRLLGPDVGARPSSPSSTQKAWQLAAVAATPVTCGPPKFCCRRPCQLTTSRPVPAQCICCRNRSTTSRPSLAAPRVRAQAIEAPIDPTHAVHSRTRARLRPPRAPTPPTCPSLT
jgi:hypothetical protein